jgi:fimbrial chaperone protein
MTKKTNISILFLFLLLLNTSLSAFVLKPISMSFAPSGQNASKSFVVVNDSDKPIAVMITIANRNIALDGTEAWPEVDDAFMVYPPQLVLMPEEQQTVKVTWMRQGDLKDELAFRMIAEQLPIDLGKPELTKGHEGGLKLMFKFVASLYVTPREGSADIVIDSVRRVTDSEQGDMLVLKMHNQGQIHTIVRRADIQVMTKSGEEMLSLIEDDFSKLKGVNMLSGLQREFKIPWPEKLPKLDLTAEARFSETPR